MKVAIVTTGDEIMSGNVVDTNSAWIADRCWMLGHKVVWHIGVPDDRRAIGEACKMASKKADTVFVTGGLGATVDDITVESAAAAFKKKMAFDEKIWGNIKSFFKRLGRECTPNNRRQAYLPKGAKPLTNKIGSAPGVMAKLGKATFFFLPGVPKELYHIFDNSIQPWLEKKSDKYHQKFLRCFGIPEASFDERLKDIKLGNVRLSFRVTFPEVKIKLVARGKNAAKEIASVEMEIRGRIGDYIFAENDITMETKIGELLTKKGLKLSIAESCTGGLISNMITNVSGSSNYFERGIISYSNRSKIEILGVKEELIEKYGAVSKECAVKMAEGVRQISGSDIGLAVTGIAGPSGGTAQKPVGTVHIAISTKDGNLHKHLCKPRERTAFKIVVAYQALDMVRRYLIRSW